MALRRQQDQINRVVPGASRHLGISPSHAGTATRCPRMNDYPGGGEAGPPHNWLRWSGRPKQCNRAAPKWRQTCNLMVRHRALSSIV